MSDLRAAREALRRRQGLGARYEAASAPHRELAWARSGTAYFARLVNALSDLSWDAPVARPGRSRRRAVALVGYQARKLSEALAFARTGGQRPLPFALAVDDGEIDLAATLPTVALRHLFSHSAVHLDVEWRDLSDADWQARVEDVAGARLKLRDTPAIRAAALWRGALDLDAGGRLEDVPEDFRQALVRGDFGDSLSRDVPSAGPLVRKGGDASMEGNGCTFVAW